VKNCLIKLTLTKTITAQQYESDDKKLNDLVIHLAKMGWELDVEELKLNKPKHQEILLGEN
jgi:hypothetical protein